MIASFRDEWLRAFFEDDKLSRKIPAELHERLFRKLQMLDDAEANADLRIPLSNHFEKLKGSLEGRRSIRVNERWRLIFGWEHGEAIGVYLADHSNR